MKYVVIDLEMNPLADEFKEEKKICKSEVIEIGAIMLDETLSEIGSFKTLVKPEYSDHIYRKYELLTGITTQMVQGAPTFAEAYRMFSNWIEAYQDDFEIYAWSENDLLQIQKEMSLKLYEEDSFEMKMILKWFDFQREYGEKVGLDRAISLDKAIELSGMDFTGRQHDALFDAKNTAELFALARDEERFQSSMKSVLEVLNPEPMVSSLGDLFDFQNIVIKSA